MFYLVIEQARTQSPISNRLKLTHWETEIDQIFARLYGLTTDDLALITGRTP